MKLKLIFLGFILYATIFIFLYSCKKDYPNDTPNWLKQKIREYKEREDPCEPPYIITEYKNDTSIIYMFEYSGSPPFGGRTFYDVLGNEICHDQPACVYCCEINGQPILEGYTKTRDIWHCEFCE